MVGSPMRTQALQKRDQGCCVYHCITCVSGTQDIFGWMDGWMGGIIGG